MFLYTTRLTQHMYLRPITDLPNTAWIDEKD